MRKAIGWLFVLGYPVLFLGLMYLENEKCGWHRGLWQDVVCKSPNKARSHLNAAVAYRHANAFNESIRENAVAAELARTNPTAADIRFHIRSEAVSNIAEIYLQGGLVDRATPLLQDVLSTDPTAGAALNMVFTYVLEKKYVEAEREADRWIVKFPNNAALYYNKGFAVAQQRDCNRAMALYQTALKVDRLFELPPYPMCRMAHS